jgi:hypothetical protein
MNVTADLPFCTVERGPLLFALALPLESSGNGKTNGTIGGNGSPAYNYAIDCDASAMSVLSASSDLPSPFDWPGGGGAPLQVVVKAAAFPWPDPWLLPDGPVDRSQWSARDGAASNTHVNLTLVPYGCAKEYHLSMFPLLGQ